MHTHELQIGNILTLVFEPVIEQDRLEHFVYSQQLVFIQLINISLVLFFKVFLRLQKNTG